MNSAMYRLLLLLYPAEFRRRWEEEMVYTFQLQLADGWFDAWRCALAELPTIAPERFAIPAISLAGAGSIFFGLTWALANGRELGPLFQHLLAKLGG
jgi:hypothetical protein